MTMKIILFLLIISALNVSGFAQDGPSIVQTESPKGWIIKTNSSAYQIFVTANGTVKHVL